MTDIESALEDLACGSMECVVTVKPGAANRHDGPCCCVAPPWLHAALRLRRDQVDALRAEIEEMRIAENTCACCLVQLVEGDPPLCVDCVGSFTHYVDGEAHCDDHPREPEI